MHERTNQIVLPDIAKYPRDDPKELSEVSRCQGIYIWWSREPLEPVYIGVALNKRGLFGRVVQQHLRATYLELRPEKTAKAAIVADYKGRKATEKSVFRKKVSIKHSLLPGTDCVEFIRNNFLVSLIPVADIRTMNISELERLLIETHKPEYNSQFKLSKQRFPANALTARK